MHKNDSGRIIAGSSEVFSDLLYATGFSASDLIYFSAGGKQFIIVSALELERAKHEAFSHINVLDRADLCAKEETRDMKAVLRSVMKQYPCSRWMIPSYFPYYYAEFMKSAGADVICSDDEFFPQRRTKSDDEKVKIAEGVAAAVKAMHKAEMVLRASSIANTGELIYQGESLTSECLKTVINLELIACGGIAKGTIASSGKQTAIPHDAGSGVLRADVPIILDIFPRIEKTGYYGDLTRTFVKGRAADIVKKAYNAVFDAREQAKREIKSGAIPDTLHRSVLKLFEDRGFRTGMENNSYFGFFHGLGHGLGLDVHEMPRFSINQMSPLEKGDVITVEPGLYYPEWGGVRLEDVVYVTESGCQCLTECPDVLEIP